MTTRYKFENWQKGKMVAIRTIDAKDTQEAVSMLSDKYDGCFRLVPPRFEVIFAIFSFEITLPVFKSATRQLFGTEVYWG